MFALHLFPLLQVASLCEYPDLLQNDLVKQLYPADAIARAKQLLDDIGSIGAYSHSKGVPAIRKNVAAFLEGARFSPSILSFKVRRKKANFLQCPLFLLQNEMDTPPIQR